MTCHRSNKNQINHAMKNFLKTFFLILIVLTAVNTLKAENISGKVLYQGDSTKPLNNVIVELKNTDNNINYIYVTNGNGHYHFNNVPDGNYILTGNTSLAAGGVTYYDPTIVFLYLNGFYQLTPIQMLASDVDGNGSVTWTDYDMIVDYILNGTAFIAGPWKFETKSFTLSSLKEGIPHGLGGTCSGDVGGTFVPTTNNTPALPLAQEGIINVTDGELFTTRILTHSELSITGAGLIINYPSELLQIESVEFKGTDYKYRIEDGQIRLVWGNPNTTPVDFNEGETFVTIHGRSTSAFKQGMIATISFDGNTSLLSPSNKELTDLHFASPVLKYGNPSLKLTNYPNPFTTSTQLKIYTAEEGNADINVYSTSGQLVKNISLGRINAGYLEVNLDASQMNPGYYTCIIRIQTSTAELSKMIRILKAE